MDPASSPSSSSTFDPITNSNPNTNTSPGLHSSESIYLLKSDNVFYFNSNAFNFNSTNPSRNNSNINANVTMNNDDTQQQTQPKTQALKKNSLEIEEYEENYEEGYLTSLNKENSFTDINQVVDTLPTTTPLFNSSIDTVTSSTKTIIPSSSLHIKTMNFTTLDVPVRDTTIVKQTTTPTTPNKKNALLLSKKSKSISNADEPYDLNEKKTNSNIDLNKATAIITASTGTTLPVNNIKTQSSTTIKTLKIFNGQSNSNLSVNKQSAQSLSTSPKKAKKSSNNKHVCWNFFV